MTFWNGLRVWQDLTLWCCLALSNVRLLSCFDSFDFRRCFFCFPRGGGGGGRGGGRRGGRRGGRKRRGLSGHMMLHAGQRRRYHRQRKSILRIVTVHFRSFVVYFILFVPTLHVSSTRALHSFHSTVGSSVQKMQMLFRGYVLSSFCQQFFSG